jgi:PA14 domain
MMNPCTRYKMELTMEEQTRQRHGNRRRARRAACRIDSLEARYLFAGTGLLAQFYNNATAPGPTANVTRVDATVNFNWGTGSPAGGINADNFAARWSGGVQPLYSEMYTFSVTGDDGYRLWVDNQLILNNYVTQTSTEATGQIALRAGQIYNIRLEYFDTSAAASISLSWSSPSQTKQVIPQSQLYSSVATDDRGSALAETWQNLNGNTLLTLKTNAGFNANATPSFRNYIYSLESIQQGWGTNSGTKVRGYLIPDVTGNYKFAVSGSSDAQFLLNKAGTSVSGATRIAYTNGSTSFRNFSQNPLTQQSATVALVAGQKYYFEVWQKAGETDNHFSVAWQTPWASTTWAVIDGQFTSPWGVDTAAPAIPTGSNPFTNLFTNASTAADRYLATPDRWAKAKALVASGGQFATYQSNIIAAADATLSDADLVYTASTTQSVLQNLESDLTLLAGAYKLTGNSRYAAKAWQKLSQALQFPTWDGGNQALGYGMGATGVAAACAWMADYLSAIDPATDTALNGTPAPQWIADKVNTLIIQPCIATLKAGTYWANWQNNWTFVCAGGAISAALAVAPYYTAAASELITRAIPRFNTVIDRTLDTNAGGSEEGPGYNTYGGVYLVKALAAMVNTLGTDYGVSRTAGFSQWCNFMFGQYANNYNNTMVMYSEGQWTGIFSAWNFYFATRFARTDTAWFIRQKLPSNTADPLTLTWWDDRGTNPSTGGYRTEFGSVGDQATYNSEQVYTTRQTWADSSWQAPTLFYKGGYFDNRHDLLDAGTWNYDSQGKRWFPVIYHSDYSLNGWDNLNTATHPNRWDYYANRGEAHNTLVINGDAGPDQVPGSNNTVVRNLSNSSETASLINMTPAYAGKGTSQVYRGFKFDKRTGMAIVQDEITPNTGTTLSTVDWYATYNQNDSGGVAPVFSLNNTQVMFTQGSARLYMRILSGGGTFDIQDAKSLYTGTNSQYLNPADGMNYPATYDRLHIRLTNVSTFTRLTVAMWGNWGTATPPFPAAATAFTNWFPRADNQLWFGDIDGGRPGNTVDAPTVDSVWQTQIIQTTGKSTAVFDSITPNRVVPFTGNFTVNAGESLSAGRLVLALRSLGTNSNGDTLYLNTPSQGTLALPFTSTTLNWATVDSLATVREVDLSTIKYGNGTSLLAAMAGGRLNVAVSGSSVLDWATLNFDKSAAPGFSSVGVKGRLDHRTVTDAQLASTAPIDGLLDGLPSVTPQAVPASVASPSTSVGTSLGITASLFSRVPLLPAQVSQRPTARLLSLS